MGMGGGGMAQFANPGGVQALAEAGGLARQAGYGGDIAAASANERYNQALQQQANAVASFYINMALAEAGGVALGAVARGTFSLLSKCESAAPLIQGGKGIVNAGRVVAHAPIEAVTSHEQLAMQSGTLLQAPVAGTKGVLVSGAEAFTYTAQGSKVLVTGSMNFNSNVSVNTVQVVTAYVKGL